MCLLKYLIFKIHVFNFPFNFHRAAATAYGREVKRRATTQIGERGTCGKSERRVWRAVALELDGELGAVTREVAEGPGGIVACLWLGVGEAAHKVRDAAAELAVEQPRMEAGVAHRQAGKFAGRWVTCNL